MQPVPPAAHEVFGVATAQAVRYAELLAGPGIVRGLLGPREAAVVWSRHILNSAALVPLLPDGASVIDLGSGAGLPGVVLALARPDLRITLVEPMARRCVFLTEAVEALGLPNVAVEQARAEECAGRLTAGVVVARAVAPLNRLVPLALPLLVRPGVLLAIKGRGAEEELVAARPAMQKFDARAEIRRLATPGSTETTTVVQVNVEPGKSHR